jgi:5'-nucleotidase
MPRQNSGKLNILVTNDDGYYSDGIKTLAIELRKFANVYVVAPDREQSASSHSLTLNRPLRVQKIAEDWYAIDGTPTDSVMLAVHMFFKKRKPDIIVSGINHGPNMGDDVTYSGTIAAAIEGSYLRIPSIAVSMNDYSPGMPFTRSANFISRLIKIYPELNLEPSVFLNVNLPKDNGRPYSKFEFTSPGIRRYRDVIYRKTDPRGKHYYWIGGTPKWKTTPGSDFEAVSRGVVSISPLRPDFAEPHSLEHLKALKLKL